jgi:mRNA-degrading endonuclease RelE of RelBE toxin-antitoxin system
MPGFKKAYKKLHSNERKVVDKAIKEIIKDPGVGEEKKGDLAEVFVYKFKFHTKEFLLGYEWCPKERLLLALGVHENFYRDLKKKL